MSDVASMVASLHCGSPSLAGHRYSALFSGGSNEQAEGIAMTGTATGESQRVTVTVTDGIADVRLNRPDKRNALDPAMFRALVTAGERLRSEPGVRAVVLS